jgi:hypothetical protein
MRIFANVLAIYRIERLGTSITSIGGVLMKRLALPKKQLLYQYSMAYKNIIPLTYCNDHC